MWIKKQFKCVDDNWCAPGCPRSEAMWIRVEKVKKDGTIVGKLDNVPICYPRKHGSRLIVQPEEVISVVPGSGKMTREMSVFHPVGTVGAVPVPKQQFGWTAIIAAALAGVTFTTVIGGLVRRSS